MYKGSLMDTLTRAAPPPWSSVRTRLGKVPELGGWRHVRARSYDEAREKVLKKLAKRFGRREFVIGRDYVFMFGKP